MHEQQTSIDGVKSPSTQLTGLQGFASSFLPSEAKERVNDELISETLKQLNKDGDYARAFSSLSSLKASNSNSLTRFLSKIPFLNNFIDDNRHLNGKLDSLNHSLLSAMLSTANDKRAFEGKSRLARALGYNPLGLANHLLAGIGQQTHLDGSYLSQKKDDKKDLLRALTRVLLGYFFLKKPPSSNIYNISEQYQTFNK